MTNLTEQLVKGTLKEYTYYYVLRNNGKTDIKMWTNKKYSSAVDWFNTYDVKEVLAEVPSYEEWQRIFHYASKYEHEYTSCAMDYENLKKENTKLKELLKESRFLLSKTPCENMSQCLTFNDVINRIDQVLGEE